MDTSEFACAGSTDGSACTGQGFGEGTGSGWQDKYKLLPFPFEQVSANPNLKQNPGW